jgi:hypothetical protein
MQGKSHELNIPQDPDEETQVRAIQQAFDLWITPEIERRKAAGTWPNGTALTGAQILLPSPLDNKPIEIRLNQEVRMLAQIEFAAPATVRPDDPVYEQDIAMIHEIARLPDEDPNAGMLAFILVNGSWHLFFDFRRDARRASKLLDLADEFAHASEESFSSGWLGPAYDNLFSAAELAARAQLLLFSFFPYGNRKDHGAIRSKYQQWTRLGNMPLKTGKALKQLAKARLRARYLEHEEAYPDFNEVHLAVQELVQRTKEQIPVTPAAIGAMAGRAH